MSRTSKAVVKTKSQTDIFLSMALDMSWRLAIAVLVPIIGGFELDKRFKTSPALTIAGFVIAMAGMAFVMWQTLQTADQLTKPPEKQL
jgi:F0F1-type ATP synthase assembly protein I